MQFKDLLENLFNLFSGKSGGAFLLEAAIVFCLVEVCKRFCLNKLKTDLTKSFDVTVLLPFVFGIVCSAIKSFLIAKNAICWTAVYSAAIDGLTIGATSTVIYRMFATFDKTNLKTLCKDGFFSILYNEILIVSDVRKKLLDKEVTLSEFVQKLTAAANGIKAIYCEDIDDKNATEAEQSEAQSSAEKLSTDAKKQQCLKTLLSGLVSDNSLEQVSDILHKAFLEYSESKLS